MGLPEDNPQGYEQGNVLTHLCHLDSPLLLMHGMADDNVLFTHSTMIMNELQRLQNLSQDFRGDMQMLREQVELAGMFFQH